MPVAHRLLFSLTALLAATAQAAVDGQKLYTQGGANPAAAACVTCHGADGMGLAAAGFPRLAGLPAAYLSKQLHDLKQGGSREHPVMKGIADALGDDEIRRSPLPSRQCRRPSRWRCRAWPPRAAPARPWRCVAPGSATFPSA